MPSRILMLAILAVSACGILRAQSTARIVGYYPSWNRQTFPPEQLRLESLTHVIYAFAWPNPDGSLNTGDAPVDTGLINTVHRAGRTILLSFGGAGTTPTANFALMTADSALRQTFVRNVLAHLAANSYDGMDLDWEGPQNSSDRSHEAALVQELHEALAQEGLLLTMAVGVTDYSGQWHDFAALQQCVDWFHAMCYDFHGSWSAHAGHNAPLFAPAFDAADGSDDLGIAYLHQTRGIPLQQLVLGLPFYGKEFNASQLYGAKTEPTIDILYGDAMAHLAAGWTYTWDTLSQVPYLQDLRRSHLDTFDDSNSVAAKCRYAKSHGLSGVMIWALGQDIWQGRQPLMEAIGKSFAAPTSIAERSDPGAPADFVLNNNYPNPFNPSTTISYTVPASRRSTGGPAGVMVRVGVYDLLGREVAALVDGPQSPGEHAIQWNAGAAASGIYFCRLQAGGFAAVKTMVLLK